MGAPPRRDRAKRSEPAGHHASPSRRGAAPTGTDLAPKFGTAEFGLGGFQRLSGYAADECRGNQVAFGSLTYLRRLPGLKPPLTRGVYLGGSLEAGHLEDTDVGLTEPGTRYGGSLFLGVDTLLSLAYLGLGVAEDGNAAGYVLIGWP